MTSLHDSCNEEPQIVFPLPSTRGTCFASIALGTFFRVGDFSLFELTLRRGLPALVFGQYCFLLLAERRLLDTRPELAAGTRYIT